MSQFNHSLMELAREAAGMSQAALAKEIGLTQATISRWEGGLFGPSPEELSQLGEVLHVTPTFFMRQDVSLGGGLPVFYHRSLAAAPARTTAQVNARCYLRSLQVDALYKMVSPPEHDFPILFTDDFKGGAVDIAAALRAKWSLGHGPVHNLVGLIESKGGIVIVEDLGCDEVDALCWWRPGLPKLFFVNARKPACRMRFSLAHEVGHTIMHTEPQDPARAEHEADLFAGEFLLPQREAKGTLPAPLTLARLAALKPWWKMSMAAIAMRAKESGVISAEALSILMRDMGSRGWRKREPVEVPHETPAIFGKMLRYPLEALHWTLEELAGALYTSVPELNKLLGNNLQIHTTSTALVDGEKPMLRLVGY